MAERVGKDLEERFLCLRSLLESLKNGPASAAEGEEVLDLLVGLQGSVASLLHTNQELEERVQAKDRKISASERRYRDLFNFAADSIFVHEPEGPFLDVNDSACRSLGYTRQELRTMTLLDLSAPEHKVKVGPRMHRVVKEGGMAFQTVLLTKDGVRIPMEVNARLVDYEGSKAILAIARNVSARQEAADILENQYHFVQTLMDAAPAPIYYKDTAGIYQGCNTAFARFMGLSREEILGRSSFEVFEPEQAELATRMDKQLLKLGGTQVYESEILTRDGVGRHALYSKATFQNTSGEVTGLVGVILDITEKKRAEVELKRSREELEHRVRERTIQLTEAYARLAASEQKHRTLYEQASEGILLVKEDGLVLDANPAGQELFSCSLEELLGSRLEEYICPESEARLQELLGAMESENTVRQELKLPCGREERYVEASAKRMETGRLMVMLRDVTRRQRISRELVQARRAAEDANQAKSEFLANMSHEIRTPIGAILGITDMAMSHGPEEPMAGLLRKIRMAADGLLNIVNDVLDFSKIEARKMELTKEDFPLAERLTRLCEEFEHVARSKGLALRFPDLEGPMHVNGDPGRLDQILSNLLSNAIKFTDRGEVELTLNTISRDQGGAVMEFRVRDTGVGIDPDKRGLLFKTFTQLEPSLNRGHGGTGLGLAICKRLVDLMGGDIWLEDNEGPGSCFCFTVPFAKAGSLEPETREEPAPLEVSKADRGRNILLAEDNLLNQEFMSYFLNEAGHRVKVVCNGAEALAALAEDPFDLVLMDVQMPGMDGLEAVRRIREHDGSKYDPDIPVVALTAFAMKGDRERIMAAGMNEYLSKPVEMPELFTLINSLAGAKG